MNKDQTFFTNDNITENKITEDNNNKTIINSESDDSIRKASLLYYLLS